MLMEEQRRREQYKKLVRLAVIVGIVYLGFRFLLPLFFVFRSYCLRFLGFRRQEIVVFGMIFLCLYSIYPI